MSREEFLGIDEDAAALEVFEAAITWLDNLQLDEAHRAVIHQNPRFWTWWRRYFANTGAAFVRASQHLSSIDARRDAWETWKASMAVGMPPKSVTRIRRAADARQG